MASGTFDSLGGTYDAQTSKTFDAKLYYEMRASSVFSALSGKTADGTMGEGTSIDKTAVIDRTKITTGDSFRKTLQNHIAGMITFGDTPVAEGDFLTYANVDVRINNIDTPAIPIQGEMAQQRVRESITNIPSSVRTEVLDFLSEQEEYDFYIACLAGASPNILKSTSVGGLGAKFGVNGLGTAGNPMPPKNFYTTTGGLVSVANMTPSTFRTAVNTAVSNLGTADGDKISTTQLMKIRKVLDTLLFNPITIGGQKYKAVALCDDDMWLRISSVLDAVVKDAGARGFDNPALKGWDTLSYKGMLFINAPRLTKFRPTTGSAVPTFGVIGESDCYTADPRTYVPASNSKGIMIFLGGGAVLEGYNDAVKITDDSGRHGKGLSISGHRKCGFVRSEWYANDGRAVTDPKAVLNYSSLVVVAYEPGL
jgi:hypothetical protein